MERLAPTCSSHDTGLGSDDSDETIDCALPAEVPTAWVTAAAWLASPPALVICGAAVKGVNLVAAADEPA